MTLQLEPAAMNLRLLAAELNTTSANTINNTDNFTTGQVCTISVKNNWIKPHMV